MFYVEQVKILYFRNNPLDNKNIMTVKLRNLPLLRLKVNLTYYNKLYGNGENMVSL
ncbi:hypothetical protein BB561_000020 [Smittium simulii]|uniref:Uncharacterized protein n=1 Tax=Smittium simulii TaxID=133385 RepID=A0A2T9YQI9_9FUNG|nr:hypothetical protein BB561_002440 [Smittium simulii]PVU98253.1 hypothetical protein BB561_000020 [Smittium simulii]